VLTALRFNWGGAKKAEEEVKKEKAPVKKTEQASAPVKKVEPVRLPEVAEDEKINIAVTDFEARAPLSQSEAAFISDFVRSDIVKTGRFNVIEGCSSAECAVAIGKVLNVKFMTVGSCGQLLGKYIITMNVVDVQSAKIIFSDDISVADPDALRENITKLVNRFFSTQK